MKFQGVIIQMKATEQHFNVAMFVSGYFQNKILHFSFSDLSCIVISFVITCSSYLW